MVRIVAVQRFSENLVEEWLDLLRDSDVRELYQAVLRPQSSGSQLKAVRKVSSIWWCSLQWSAPPPS